jgi:hypothetical protein
MAFEVVAAVAVQSRVARQHLVPHRLREDHLRGVVRADVVAEAACPSSRGATASHR